MATLAPSLVRLRAEINHAFPHRDKTSDGWLGDAAHQARTSDHNADARGIVHAIDVDVDDGDPSRDLRSILIRRAIAHPATHYVISNGRIYSREYGFRARAYTGSNGHYHHVHVSILHTRAAETSARPWGVAAPAAAPYRWTHLPLRRGDRNVDVAHAQKRLGIHVDGVFGLGTLTAVRSFQQRHHLTVDGVVGPVTAKAIG